MSSSPQWLFDPFRLDPDQACLWSGAHAIALTPKAFDVLHYLVTHPSVVVTKDALLDAVWPETAVSEGALRAVIGELRHALRDSARTPQFLATMHRRGYRFLAPVTMLPAAAPIPPAPPAPAVDSSPAPTLLVERETALQRLQAAWRWALQGERQVVLVTGEAGIGKTSVIEAFVSQVSTEFRGWLGRGQCVAYYGPGEAYMPILEALEQLCRVPGAESLVALLRQRAPTWLVQIPWLLSKADREQLQYELQGTTRERMLREFADVVDALTSECPLLLVLEDLHWSDYATLDLIALLARRQTPARFLLLGSYRPTEARVHELPLRTVLHEVQRHAWSVEIPLAQLSPEAVATYVARRYPGQHVSGELMRLLQQRTEGHPLFMVHVVESWFAQQGQDTQAGLWDAQGGEEALQVAVPERLRHLIEHQLESLRPEEQAVLEAGSVAGVTFSAATIAAGLGQTVEQVDVWCTTLARQGQWLRRRGEQSWPDGTLAGCYGFAHALYQEVLYQRVPPARRVHLHRQIGMRLEVGYGVQVDAVATELAIHFGQGRDIPQAVAYRQRAANIALQRWAYGEAIAHLATGMELLSTIPETPARWQRELDILTALGPAFIATQGLGSPAVGRTYTHAHALCQQLDAPPQRFTVLHGLARFALLRSDLQISRALGEQLLCLAEAARDSDQVLEAHRVLGVALCESGLLVSARAHLEQGVALYKVQRHRGHMELYAQDPGMVCHSYLALVLWLLGYPTQAQQQSQSALSLANDLADPYNLSNAFWYATFLQQFCRNVTTTAAQAEATMALATAHGFAERIMGSTMFRVWALTRQGRGSAQMVQQQQRDTMAYVATGANVALYYLALLAESYCHIGQPGNGLRVLSETLTMEQPRTEIWWEAELYRLRGELLLQPRAQGRHTTCHQPSADEAEACFHRALAIARRQQAKSLELRAAMSLAELWQQQGKAKEAQQILADIYGWFSEGFETADLQDAAALLDKFA